MRRSTTVFSDHLLVVLTLAFCLGIAVAFITPFGNALVPPLRLGVVFLALFLLALHYLGCKQPMPLLLALLFALFGLSHTLHHLQPPADQAHLFNRIPERREAIVSGTLLAAPEFDGKLSRVRIASSHLRFPDDPRFLPTQGTLLLHLAAPWPSTILPGDSLVVRADLKRPDGHRAPGAFDYPRYLALQGILMSGFSRSPLFVHELQKEQGFWHRLRYAPERARSRIGHFIDNTVKEEHRGLYRAILIGDASAIDDQVLESFKGSGTIHILSISGLHLTIIGTLLYGGLYWLFSRSSHLLVSYPLRKWAAFLCLPALIGYSLLAGLNIPVFRAMVMSCVAILGICWDRSKSPSTLLAAAALIILAIDPLALALPSFQLSFAATAAILFLVPILKVLITSGTREEMPSLLRRFGRWLLAGLLVSVAATAATAPLTLHAFNRFSAIGIIANLVVEPLICLWSLPCGFLALPLTTIAPDLASLLLHLGSPGLTFSVSSATFFANLPFASFWRPSPPGWLLTLCAIGFTGILWGWRTTSPRRTLAASTLFALSLAVMLLPFPIAPPSKGHNLELTVLDVGQGSATFLRFPTGTTVLIDGGGSAANSSSVGERVIAPFLWHQGIAALDAIVITHPDADHFNGLAFILTHFTPKALWVRDHQGHDEEYRDLLRLAERLGVRVRVPGAGEVLQGLGPGESLQCLINTVELSASSPLQVSSRDNSGLVIKACLREDCALFPGDIDSNEETQLVASGTDLRATVLLAPHHGSASSNSRPFLAAVDPDYLLVSAGRGGNNSKRFPHPALPEDCRDLGISLLTTPQRGTLRLELVENTVSIAGYGRQADDPFQPNRQLAIGEESRP